jgi:Tfp pilus assembly protein PilO
MNKNDLLENLRNQKVKEYGFTISFFLIFSFFVVFAIRPNLTSVISLNEQLTQLRGLDVQYENSITKIITLQSLIEQNRENFYLLDESLPSTPQVNKVIDDIKKNASESGLVIDKIVVDEVSLKGDTGKKKMRSFSVDLETTSEFENIKKFVSNLFLQRRLKSIQDLTLERDITVSSGSAPLKIKLEIGGYYL